MGVKMLSIAARRFAQRAPIALAQRCALPSLASREFATVYTSDHEWVSDPVDGVVTVGITDFAQNALGDVVYVELPDVGDTFEQHDNMGVVESVKAASDVYSPVSGEIVEINEELPDEPSVINTDPQEAGWWVKIKLSKAEELEELMSEDAYNEFCEEN